MARRRATRRPGSGLAGLVLLLIANLAGPAGAAPPYELGPMDRIRIVVSEWSSTGGEIRVRLTGEFTVDSAGLLAVPTIGMIQVAGQTLTDVSQTISDRMQARAGLINPPVTAIEIIQYRPFYILGFVEKPGEYAYRPGMSVLQAVAIAGGVFRVPNAAHLRLERDAVAARGEAGLQRARLDELLIRRARVQAELTGKSAIDLPAELAERSADRIVVGLLQKEHSNLVARRDALAASIREQQELRKLAQDEEVSLRDQMKAQELRLAVVEREADESRSLKARGLTTSAREFSITAAAAEVEARKRALITEILRAGQSIVRADQAVRTLQSERGLQLLAELDSLRTALEEAENRRRTAEALLDEADATGQLYGAATVAQDRAPSYLVIRRSGDREATMVAADLTEILPGDLIRVVPPPSLQRPWESAGGPGRRG